MPGAQDFLQQYNISRSPTPPQQFGDDINLPLAGQKRKFDGIADTACIWRPFKVRNIRDGTCTLFEPRLLLPRSSLPLAFLGSNQTSAFGKEESVFSAHVPALETADTRKETYTPPVILVAERNGKSMYAIERVHHGIYAQCKLGSWVTIEHLQRLQKIGTTTAAPVETPCVQETHDWWRTIVAKEMFRPSIADQSQAAMSSENALLNLNPPGYVSNKSGGSPQPASPGEPTEAVAVNMMGNANISPHESPQLSANQLLHDLDTLLQSIKVQYMESLYRSKVPLAYFAKGPLSRARAAVSDTENPATSQRRLIDYLQDLVVPLNLLDKKYRDTVPALVTEFPKTVVSEDERTEVVARYQKNCRRSKNGKIRKNGLYPQEDVDFLQWWLDCKGCLSDCENPEFRAETMSSLILDQRTRETKLQIILMLEIMALEKSQPRPTVEIFTEVADKAALVPQRKKGKGQGLDLLLDLSLDRLCIWQSMTAEDNISRDAEEAETRFGEISRGKMQDFNHLREFCVDVVMPLTVAPFPHPANSEKDSFWHREANETRCCSEETTASASKTHT
ncbi:MAG: hypothetical protein Q9203_000845 [Teloschistes exilis]